MVPPTLFLSGGVCVLQLCKEVYCRFQHVKRFREDCRQLARFVQRIEAFIAETEQDADMSGPGWQAAFSALHESLQEVVDVFDDCARFGMLRSLINADEINLRLSAITQRLSLSLGMIPIQKAKVAEMRLAELTALQADIRGATFAAARAAEQTSADLKRLMDQSRVDTDKTQEMLAQVLALLQADPAGGRAAGGAAAAAAGGPRGDGAGAACPPAPAPAVRQPLSINPAQLEAEVADLQAEQEVARRQKNVIEEQYLEQVIAAISAMEATRLEQQEEQQQAAAAAAADVPSDLRCPITYQLLQDPVLLVESHQTYERAAIEEWLGRGNTKDPITGMQLPSTTLVPNVLARKMAQDWKDAHPEHATQAATAAAAAAAADERAASTAAAWQHAGAQDAKAKAAAAAVSSRFDITVDQQPIKAAGGGAGAAAGAAAGGADADPGGSAAAEALVFEVNPKTAALLAAAEKVAACDDGEDFFVLPPPAAAASAAAATAAPSPDAEKREAQRAYAAAVAAAAAADAAAVAVPVAVVMHQAPSLAMLPRTAFAGAGQAPLDAAAPRGSVGAAPDQGGQLLQAGTGSSSVTLAAQLSHTTASVSPPSSADGPLVAASGGAQASVDAAAAWQGFAPQPVGPPQMVHHQWPAQPPQAPPPQPPVQQQQQPVQQQFAQQQQQPPSTFGQQPAWQQQPVQPSTGVGGASSGGGGGPTSAANLLHGFVPAGGGKARGSRDVQAAAAAAAAATLQHHRTCGSGGGSGFTLQHLQATLGRAAETRREIVGRHGGQLEASAAASNTYEQAQQRRQQAAEAEYLQQHMQQLMAGGGAPGPASQPLPGPVALAPHQQQLPHPAVPHAPMSAGGGVSMPPPGSSSHHHQQQQATAAMQLRMQAQQATQQAQAAQRVRQQHPSTASSGAAPGSALSGPASGPLLASSSSRGSWTGFARRKKGASGSGNDDSESVDDSASMCSEGSSASRRSLKAVGKGMRGLLKNISYTMVYDDDKV